MLCKNTLISVSESNNQSNFEQSFINKEQSLCRLLVSQIMKFQLHLLAYELTYPDTFEETR